MNKTSSSSVSVFVPYYCLVLAKPYNRVQPKFSVASFFFDSYSSQASSKTQFLSKRHRQHLRYVNQLPSAANIQYRCIKLTFEQSIRRQGPSRQQDGGPLWATPRRGRRRCTIQQHCFLFEVVALSNASLTTREVDIVGSC